MDWLGSRITGPAVFLDDSDVEQVLLLKPKIPTAMQKYNHKWYSAF
jgi:hypothetical protein